MTETAQVDFLIIGSGIAGLWFAWKVGGRGKVLIVTKKDSAESNTNYAQGGIAAAVAHDDNPTLHYEDTIQVGAGLAHPEIVRMVTEAAPRLVRELWALGIRFSTLDQSTEEPRFELGQEGGHRRRRIVHAQDATGAEIERGLLAAVRSQPDVTIWEEHFTIDLVLDATGVCCGAVVLDKSTGKIKTVIAKVCLLATGGIGQVYLHTTNPAIATGDGIAMAYRAGAKIANMEFIQFHPTTLFGHRIEGRVFLISEAVRGEGAVLRTKDGKEFMSAYHLDGSLAPRDVVARAIAAELVRRGDEFVLLDCSSIPSQRLIERFPNIYRTCLKLGIDITRQPIPVVPAAHYVCGGISVNQWAETSIENLFAAGECAATGLHGANRLASNSLLEALFFAERAVWRAKEKVKEREWGCKFTVTPRQIPFVNVNETQEALLIVNRLRETMWRYAGIIRTDAGLSEAERELLKMNERIIDRLKGVERPLSILELRNMLTVANLIVACARRRPESRGLHFNQDHPLPNKNFERDTVVSQKDLNAFLPV
ncbi:MAG: L-aspartate oxidase [bacterium]